MKWMVLTRLVLPLLLVGGLVTLPFIWLPEVSHPVKEKTGTATASRPSHPEKNKKSRRPRTTPFQRVMTLGFALILVSVSIGGAMLYSITRTQTASWRRRFAPPKKKAGKNRSDKNT